MNTFNYPLSVLLAAILTLSISSCAKDDFTSSDEISVSDEALAQIDELGMSSLDVEVSSLNNPITGEFSPITYKIEGDILITPEQLAEMALSKLIKDAPMTEQYRTSNLVSSPRTITVLGYTGGSNALDNTMQTALGWAVDNYNALNIGLTFTLAYGTNYQSYDMVVYKVTGTGGGSAGFPSGGDPYQFIQIQSGTSSYGTNVTEHVIAHEMGHSIGMRHTDYFNRSLSCGGSASNEGTAGVGAINIPGTPTGTDTNSLMQACFSSTEDGEFGAYDVIAFEYLY